MITDGEKSIVYVPNGVENTLKLINTVSHLPMPIYKHYVFPNKRKGNANGICNTMCFMRTSNHTRWWSLLKYDNTMHVKYVTSLAKIYPIVEQTVSS